MDAREERGKSLAQDKRLKHVDGSIWFCPSQTSAGGYIVNLEARTCTCLDHETRGCKCKHIYAVEYTMRPAPESETTDASESLCPARVSSAYVPFRSSPLACAEVSLSPPPQVAAFTREMVTVCLAQTSKISKSRL